MAPRCGICMEDDTFHGMTMVVTRCGHAFCDPCLALWLQQCRTCPSCRSPVCGGDGGYIKINRESRPHPSDGPCLMKTPGDTLRPMDPVILAPCGHLFPWPSLYLHILHGHDPGLELQASTECLVPQSNTNQELDARTSIHKNHDGLNTSMNIQEKSYSFTSVGCVHEVLNSSTMANDNLKLPNTRINDSDGLDNKGPYDHGEEAFHVGINEIHGKLHSHVDDSSPILVTYLSSNVPKSRCPTCLCPFLVAEDIIPIFDDFVVDYGNNLYVSFKHPIPPRPRGQYCTSSTRQSHASPPSIGHCSFTSSSQGSPSNTMAEQEDDDMSYHTFTIVLYSTMTLDQFLEQSH